MSPVRNELVDMIDNLSDAQQLLLYELVSQFVADDDIATVDDIAAIKAAREEYANGETVNLKDLDWN